MELFSEAEKAGITVEYMRLPLNKSMSVSDPDGEFILMDYSLTHVESRERVHLAHELGHCLTGSFYNPYSGLDSRRKHENTADKWAIQKLIPKDKLDAAVRSGLTEVWELAEHFDVPVDFMRKAICWYKYGNLSVEMYWDIAK